MTEPRYDRTPEPDMPAPLAPFEEAGSASLYEGDEPASATELQLVSLGEIIAERDAPMHEEAQEQSFEPEEAQGGWLRTFLPGKAGLRAQLTDLNRAIAEAPNAASNYLLRGELLAKLGRYALAQGDFVRARELAHADAAESRWGLVGQVVQDRAVAGLADIRHYLAEGAAGR